MLASSNHQLSMKISKSWPWSYWMLIFLWLMFFLKYAYTSQRLLQFALLFHSSLNYFPMICTTALKGKWYVTTQNKGEFWDESWSIIQGYQKHCRMLGMCCKGIIWCSNTRAIFCARSDRHDHWSDWTGKNDLAKAMQQLIQPLQPNWWSESS